MTNEPDIKADMPDSTPRITQRYETMRSDTSGPMLNTESLTREEALAIVKHRDLASTSVLALTTDLGHPPKEYAIDVIPCDGNWHIVSHEHEGPGKIVAKNHAEGGAIISWVPDRPQHRPTSTQGD